MESLFNLPTKPENANECYALAFNSKNIEFLISLFAAVGTPEAHYSPASRQRLVCSAGKAA
jgi:hypothetical protein